MKTYNGYNYSNNEQFNYFYCAKGTEKPWVTGFKTEEEVKAAIDEQVERDNTPATDPVEEQITDLQLAMTELAELVVGGNE